MKTFFFPNLDCGSLKQLNANVELPTNKTTYGEQAVITCNIGYRPGGSTSVSCQANGTWEKWPECEVIGEHLSMNF